MRRLLLAAIFLVGAAGAAMAVDFSQIVKTFDGKDFTNPDGTPAPQVLGTIVENSLAQSTPNDTIAEKQSRFWLMLKIHEHAKNPDLSSEDLSVIKKAIGTYQPIAIMGQALRLIDPTSVPKN
jgi:hypothetical protein